MPDLPTRRQRRLVLIAVAAFSVALAGCSSSGSSSSGSASGSSSSATATGSAASTSVSSTAGITHAETQLAAYSAVASSFSAPGVPLRDPAKLKGGTITYIPLFLLVPYFGAVYAQLRKAAALVGMTVRVCNPNATPSGVATCFSQAIDAKTDGIITDAVPYSYASDPYAAAAAAGIPVAALDIGDQPPAALAGHAVTLDDGIELEGQLLADSIIAASHGTADALLVVSTTNSESVENYHAMEQEFSQYCPGCRITQVINNETDQESSISLAISGNPSIQYVV